MRLRPDMIMPHCSGPADLRAMFLRTSNIVHEADKNFAVGFRCIHQKFRPLRVQNAVIEHVILVYEVHRIAEH